MKKKKPTAAIKKRKALTAEQKVARHEAVKSFHKRRQKLGFQLMWVHNSVRQVVEAALKKHLEPVNE